MSTHHRHAAFHTSAGIIAALLGFILLVVLIASLPEVFSLRLNRIVLRLGSALERGWEYLSSIGSGELFLFQAGSMQRNFLQELGPYWMNSFSFFAGGLFIGVIVGTIAGILAGRYDLKRLEGFASSLGLVPDFLLALLLQIAVIGVTVATGYRIARVASLGPQPAVLLPLIVMSLYPAVASMQIAAERVHHFRGEQFVVNLVARGIPTGRIYRVHLVPGVFDGIRRELPRILGTHAATLFITERIFQSRGIVRWMFRYAFEDQGALQLGGYQYGFMIHCLLALLTVILVTFALIRLALNVVPRVLRHV